MSSLSAGFCCPRISLTLFSDFLGFYCLLIAVTNAWVIRPSQDGDVLDIGTHRPRLTTRQSNPMRWIEQKINPWIEEQTGAGKLDEVPVYPVLRTPLTSHYPSAYQTTVNIGGEDFSMILDTGSPWT